MAVSLESLPERPRRTLVALRDGLNDLLGTRLRALWAYGAVTFEDRPARLGDVDAHAVVADEVATTVTATSVGDEAVRNEIRALHERIERAAGLELDAWTITESAARGSVPPSHVLEPDIVDRAWALHRAHWLAGRVVILAGSAPASLLCPPSWSELREGLRQEVAFLESVVSERRTDPGYTAFVILNACRIVYSRRTRDVVTSKRAAGRWALEHLPSRWHAAIEAADRVYAMRDRPTDAGVLVEAMAPLVAELDALAPEGEEGTP